MGSPLQASPRPRRGGAARALSLAIVLGAVSWAAPATAFCYAASFAGPMTFTGYSPLGGGVMATATLSYACFFPIPATRVSISTPRAMTSGASSLAFELYTDSTRATSFPDTPGLSVPGSGTVTVYGWLAPGLDAAAGTYAGTLNVTVGDGWGSVTTQLSVSTTIAGACEIQAGTLAFGSYDPAAAAPRDVDGIISIACTRSTQYRVGLGAGNNASGTTRQMAGPGADRLEYQLYSDTARTTPWDTTSIVRGTAPSVAPIPLVVHGRIPAGQLVQAGGYSDVVQSTINF